MKPDYLWVPKRIDAACDKGVMTRSFPEVRQAALVLAEPQPWADAVRRDAQGRVLVTCFTDMPSVTPAMIDWWFGWHLTHSERYRLWHPFAHVGCTVQEDRSACPNDRDRYIGNISHVDEYIGQKLMKLSIAFRPPDEIHMGSANADDCTTIYATTADRVMRGQGGQLVHHVVRHENGAQMRSGFWLGEITHANTWVQQLLGPALNSKPLRRVLVPDSTALGLLRHCAEEMNHLARILPPLYEKRFTLPQ